MTNNVLAVILHQEDWRERDVVITMYTRERGKIEALAKGMRKIESKLAGHLEPLMTAEIFLAKGRFWPIIAGSVAEQARLELRCDYERLRLAGAVAHLADLMTPLDSYDTNIYKVLDDTLTIVASNHLGQSHGELLVHIFAWKLMVLSGYRPELKHCLHCRRSSIVGKALLDIRRGGVIHESCWHRRDSPAVPASKSVLKGLSYMVKAPIYDTLRLRGTGKSFEEMKKAIALLVEERYEQSFNFHTSVV